MTAADRTPSLPSRGGVEGPGDYASECQHPGRWTHDDGMVTCLYCGAVLEESAPEHQPRERAVACILHPVGSGVMTWSRDAICTAHGTAERPGL